MRPFVKICGLKRADDAELAVALGATHVGVVRAPTSPRRASLSEVRAIFDAVGERCERVLVFKDVPVEVIAAEAESTRASAVQLFEHDEHSLPALEPLGLRVYRVYGMDTDARKLPERPEPSAARPAVLDVGGGGSGRRFDWTLLGPNAPDATFIAGGIDPDNIRSLLDHRPYGIDLSSGVERAPGVKDEEKMRALFKEIFR